MHIYIGRITVQTQPAGGDYTLHTHAAAYIEGCSNQHMHAHVL